MENLDPNVPSGTKVTYKIFLNLQCEPVATADSYESALSRARHVSDSHSSTVYVRGTDGYFAAVDKEQVTEL